MSKSHRNCVVPGCPNRRDRCKWGLFRSDKEIGGRVVYVKRRLCGSKNCGNKSDVCQAVTFSRIPKDSPKRGDLRKQWLSKIPRNNIPSSSHSCVCSVHFPGGVCDYRRGDVPLIFEGSKVLPAARKTGARTVGLDQSKAGQWSASPQAATDVEGDEAMGGRDLDSEMEIDCVLAEHFYTSKSADYLQRTVNRQQEVISKLEQKIASLESDLLKCQKDLDSCRMSCGHLRRDPTVFKFYTGVSVDTFENVKRIVGDAPESMDYTGKKTGEHDGKSSQCSGRKLCVDDELVLTLVKLRHDFPESDLANRFCISQSTVSRIFSTWVLCLYSTFKEISTWPSRQLIDKYMPSSFQQKYPSTRVVIDATEFRMEKPANPDVQAATWSNYKNTNTFKLLVGVTPNGVISFLSPLWGGRISDKQITIRSDLFDLLEPGDAIMADRGFDIASLMPAGTSLNIPPFLGVKTQFDEEELVATRRIASLRIHVERAMERIKNFQMTQSFPASLCPLAEPIIFTCAFLTIFEPPLVPPDAH